MTENCPDIDSETLIPRIVFGTFGLGFGGIGLAVLSFLWLTPFNQFGSPPLFFRIFGSFIALMFVVMGGGTLAAAIAGKGLANRAAMLARQQQADINHPAAEPKPSVGYTCSKCGAPLGVDAEVSPLGDVKCSFCHQWFNIHNRAAG